MHPCRVLLALSIFLAASLGVVAQELLQLCLPGSIYQCVPATFNWTGGTPSFSLSWARGYGAIGDDSNTSEDTLITKTDDYAAVFKSSRAAGQFYRFTIRDEAGQSAKKWREIQYSDACNSLPLPIIISDPIPSPTSTTPPPTPTVAPGQPSTAPTETITTEGPLPSTPSTTITPGQPPTAPAYSIPSPSTPSTTITPGSTTTKYTTKASHPLPTPANPSDPSESHPPSPGDPSEGPLGPSSGTSGTSGISGGGMLPGETRTPNQPTNGQVPTQTASPRRNTQDEEQKNVSMSTQAKGAIIGTITGAFLLFVGFLGFRWRKRHLQKHRPAAILPGVGSSGDDLTAEVFPTIYHDPPQMQSSEYPIDGYPGMAFASPASLLMSRPVTAPLRLLPSTKQAMAARPWRRPSSDDGNEDTASLSAGTWRSSHGETSRSGSISYDPEDQMPPPADDILGPTSHLAANLQPMATSAMPSPLSLQQLIGRELDNILSSPDTCSPDSPLYTPASISMRDPHGLRIMNGTEQSSSSGGGPVASSSKHPYALRAENGDGARTPDLGSASTSAEDSRGGRPRVAISRNDMQYLADLVAARITRETGQGTRPGLGHGPPPSYV